MAETWTVILTYLIVIVSASLEGVNHAILWSGKKTESFDWNEHRLFVLQRLVFGAALMFTASWAGFIAALFAYPLFHNGFYYATRDYIDSSYPKEFFADSKGSSAMINFNVNIRITMFIGSIGLLIFALIKL